MFYSQRLYFLSCPSFEIKKKWYQKFSEVGLSPYCTVGKWVCLHLYLKRHVNINLMEKMNMMLSHPAKIHMFKFGGP